MPNSTPYSMTGIYPFRIDVPDGTLDRIRMRVAEYPWHEMPNDGGWAYGRKSAGWATTPN